MESHGRRYLLNTWYLKTGQNGESWLLISVVHLVPEDKTKWKVMVADICCTPGTRRQEKMESHGRRYLLYTQHLKTGQNEKSWSLISVVHPAPEDRTKWKVMVADICYTFSR
ncbi:hypothetical protein PoB_005828400 [Plakobranchus ocellatus]|uniref:Uncharacterized protein n=1 Tax=Plakobranchus ocellatus TaxID=259542 RepID=A0AAV4CKQ4_9GAST|nr:hypothetical protein PoB_005828400 [Plakobranchus ocellatus]